MSAKALGLVVASALLVGCTGSAPPRSVQKQLRVTGPEAGVTRFAALQESRHPPLTVSKMTRREGGAATALVRIPPEFNNKQILQITRQALDAGLSYEYQATSTPKHRQGSSGQDSA